VKAELKYGSHYSVRWPRGLVVLPGLKIETGGTHFSLMSTQYHAENDVPQPHEREEFGLMKLKPWRISVSS